MIIKAYLIAAYFFLIGYHVRVRRERIGKKTSCVYVHLGAHPCVEPVTLALHHSDIEVRSIEDAHYSKMIPAIRGAHLEIDAA
jgi:hypothetical protein